MAAPMRRSDIESMPAGSEMDMLVARHVFDCTPRLITPIRFQLWGSDESSARYWGCGCGGHLHAIYPHSDAPVDTHYEQGRLAAYSRRDDYALSVLDAIHARGFAWTAKRYRPGVFVLPGDSIGPAYRVSIYDDRDTHDGYGDSLAIAVCRAALIAVLDLEPELEQDDTNAG